MSIQLLLTTIFLAVLPISELRGAIPYAYFNGTSLLVASLIGTLANLLVAPLAHLFLTYFHQFFYKYWPFYKKIFDSTIIRVQTRMSAKIEKYGLLGVLLFVGIPLPVTGAWTGTLGAWLLGLKKRHLYLAVSGGVIMASIIITTILFVGSGVGSIFIKTV